MEKIQWNIGAQAMLNAIEGHGDVMGQVIKINLEPYSVEFKILD